MIYEYMFGDKMHPCITPLSLLTQSVSSVHSLYFALVSTYMLLIILTILSLRPTFSSTLQRTSLFTLSYAFFDI